MGDRFCRLSLRATEALAAAGLQWAKKVLLATGDSGALAHSLDGRGRCEDPSLEFSDPELLSTILQLRERLSRRKTLLLSGMELYRTVTGGVIGFFSALQHKLN